MEGVMNANVCVDRRSSDNGPVASAVCDEAITETLHAALEEYAEKRLIQVHLRATRFASAAVELPLLRGYIQLAALSGFLSQRGVRIAATTGSGNDPSRGLSPAKNQMIEVAPGRHAAVHETGLVFLVDEQDRRAVLKIGTEKRH